MTSWTTCAAPCIQHEWVHLWRIQYRVLQMPDSSASPLPKTSSTAWQATAAGACFVASLVACLLGYLAFAAPGRWLNAPPSLEWKARELTTTRGSGQVASGRLVVAAPDAARTVVISLNTSFRARDYPVVAWDASGIPDKLEATLL